LTVDKRLSLIGEDKNDTIISGSWTGVVVYVKSDNVEITNFIITKSGGEWIECRQSSEVAGLLQSSEMGSHIKKKMKSEAL